MELIPRGLIEGARNCVLEYGEIGPGTNVLILNEIGKVDHLAVQAVALVAEEAGANVSILYTQTLPKSWWEDVPPIVLAAFEAADVVIHNHYTIGRPNKPIHKAMFEKGVVMVRNYGSNATILGSDWATFPRELYNAIELRLGEQLLNAKSYRVTDAAGTDISGECTGAVSHRQSTQVVSRSPYRHFPPGVHVPIRSHHASGIIAMVNTYPRGARLWGLPETIFDHPVRLTVEDNWVTNIEGDYEAELMKKAFEFIASEGTVGKDAYRVTSWHNGMHHQAFSPISSNEDADLWHGFLHHHTAFFHFHVGLDPSEDTGSQYMTHLQATCLNATIWLDGEKVLENGRLTLLSDPDLREMAAKYGDPDVLLAFKPFRL